MPNELLVLIAPPSLTSNIVDSCLLADLRMSGYPPHSPSSRSRTLSTHTRSDVESSDGEALYFAARKSKSPSRDPSTSQDVELTSNSNSSKSHQKGSTSRQQQQQATADESQPLNLEDSNYDYNSSSDSERQQADPSTSNIAILPRLVGGNHKSSDGIYHHDNPNRNGRDRDEHDMQDLEESGLNRIQDSKLRTRAYWRAAGVNVSLILSWCEYQNQRDGGCD